MSLSTNAARITLLLIVIELCTLVSGESTQVGVKPNQQALPTLGDPVPIECHSVCEKGEKGVRGLANKGEYISRSFFLPIHLYCIDVAGEKGVPGVCHSICSNSVDLGICSQIALSLGREIVSHGDDTSDDKQRRSAYSAIPVLLSKPSYNPILLNKLRIGVLTVDQLSVVEAKGILLSFCITAELGGTESCKETIKLPYYIMIYAFSS